jgi:hypothetical protein
MAVERERGVSVSSAVMSFEHERLAFNLVDTPPPDFSEDTYRALTAVECGDGDSTPPKLPKGSSTSRPAHRSRCAGSATCRS